MESRPRGGHASTPALDAVRSVRSCDLDDRATGLTVTAEQSKDVQQRLEQGDTTGWVTWAHDQVTKMTPSELSLLGAQLTPQAKVALLSGLDNTKLAAVAALLSQADREMFALPGPPTSQCNDAPTPRPVTLINLLDDAFIGPRAGSVDLGRELLEEVRRRIEQGEDVNQRSNDADAVTPLMISANRFESVVACLLAAGAHIDVQSNDGSTALMFAAKAGATECIDVLLAHEPKPNVNAQSKFGYTALQRASSYGHSWIVARLLAAGAQPDLTFENGETTIMFAALEGHVECVEALLAHEPMLNLDVQERRGRLTALMSASREGRSAIVARLLAAGARADLKDRDGDDALHHAINKGHAGCAKLIRQREPPSMGPSRHT